MNFVCKVYTFVGIVKYKCHETTKNNNPNVVCCSDSVFK